LFIGALLMIGHLETVIQTRFIRMDSDGNVIETTPVTLKLTALESDQFDQARKHMLQAKSNLEEAETSVKNSNQPIEGVAPSAVDLTQASSPQPGGQADTE
jgi:hypothetical protein